MNRQKKESLRVELQDKFQKSVVAIFADYQGLTASQADEFRRLVRSTGGEVKVIKNNVYRLVHGEKTQSAKSVVDFATRLVGPTLVAFGYSDIAKTSKVVFDFSKNNEKLVLKKGLLGEEVVGPEAIQSLASLPSREVLMAQLLGVLNGPIRNFVSVLAAVPRSLMNVLQAIKEKKEGQ